MILWVVYMHPNIEHVHFIITNHDVDGSQDKKWTVPIREHYESFNNTDRY